MTLQRVLDGLPDDSVLRFRKLHEGGANDGLVLTYALLKAAGYWYRTGQDCPAVPQRMSSAELVDWLQREPDPIGPGQVIRMTSWGTLL